MHCVFNSCHTDCLLPKTTTMEDPVNKECMYLVYPLISKVLTTLTACSLVLPPLCLERKRLVAHLFCSTICCSS